MQCKCGGTMREGTHKVSTIKGAKDWYEEITEEQLPIKIMQNQCECTRTQYVVADKNGEILKRFG